MGVKVGDTVKARLPQRYTVSTGAALVKQNVTDRTVDIAITDQKHVGIEFSAWSQTLEVNDYRKRYIDPATDAIVNDIDSTGLTRMTKKVFWTVGTPAVIPGSTGTLPQAANQVYGNAGVKLDNAAVPVDDRVAILSPAMHSYLANANNTVFNPAAAISDAFRKGMFASNVMGVDKWYKDQNVYTHTVGTLGGTPLINGANQTGASIVTDAWTSAVAVRLNEGDIIQFAGVYAVNPQSYASTGQLQDFTVLADASSDGSGNLTVSISPSIITSGAFQTVTGSPADNAAVTTFSHASTYAAASTPQGLIYHPDSFALVMADLVLPGGLWVAERISNKALGVAIRFLKGHNIDTDQTAARVDVAYGWAAVRAEMACRISS